MKVRLPVFMSPVLATLALAVLLADPIAANHARADDDRLQLPWENNRFRLTRIAVAPGATLPVAGDRILVYLTADADGRMPAEAVWQSAGAGAVQNRGPARLEAIAIELKDARSAAAGTPSEALDAPYGVDVTPLINNERVLVLKHRYEPIAYGGPLHFHGEDVLVIYLRGGYAWPLADLWGPSRVRRGEVDVIPANTPHRLGNAGGDPLELLVIVPK